MAANEPGQPGPLNSTALATPTTTDLATPSSALAIGAHPDDVEFGAGGTLAKWAADGCVVHHLVCTECGEAYPIEDGIPNLLPPDMREGTAA